MEENKITHKIIGSIIVPGWYDADTFVNYLCSPQIRKHYASNGVYSVKENDIALFTKKPNDLFEADKTYDVCLCYLNGNDVSHKDLLDYIQKIGGLITGVHGAGIFYIFSMAPYNTQYISIDQIENLPENDGRVIVPRVCESDGHGCFYSSLSTRPYNENALSSDCCYLTFIPKKV